MFPLFLFPFWISMMSKDLILHVICFLLALTDYFYPSSIKGATFLIWLSRHEVIPNFVGFLPQIINHSQRMLGSIILYGILSSCVFPGRWSCTETLPSDNVKTEDCSGPQLLKILTLGQGKNNTSWSDARHVNDFNLHVLAFFCARASRGFVVMIKQQKAAKWRETIDQSYNLNLSIPMLSKLFKTAQNRFSSLFPRKYAFKNSQLTKFPNHLAFSIKSSPPKQNTSSMDLPSCHQTMESNFLTVKIPRSSFLDIWHAIGCSHRSTIKEVDPLDEWHLMDMETLTISDLF